MPDFGMSSKPERLLVVCGLIQRSSGAREFLITRRAMDGHLPGSWELPGGKIEQGESPEEALHRELDEELGIRVAINSIFSVGHHVYPKREVILLVYQTTLLSGEPECRVALESRWASPTDICEMDFPPANARFLDTFRGIFQ